MRNISLWGIRIAPLILVVLLFIPGFLCPFGYTDTFFGAPQSVLSLSTMPDYIRTICDPIRDGYDYIKSIYTGKTTDWSAVGGKRGEIASYQRNPDSGSQTLFDKLLGLGNDLVEPPEGRQVGTMMGLLEAIADYDDSENALGYTVYYYLTNMESEKLNRAKILAVGGVAPTNETIGNGTYPLTNDFYVVIRKSAKENSPERVLYNWICSAQGAKLVQQENYPVRKAN